VLENLDLFNFFLEMLAQGWKQRASSWFYSATLCWATQGSVRVQPEQSHRVLSPFSEVACPNCATHRAAYYRNPDAKSAPLWPHPRAL